MTPCHITSSLMSHFVRKKKRYASLNYEYYIFYLINVLQVTNLTNYLLLLNVIVEKENILGLLTLVSTALPKNQFIKYRISSSVGTDIYLEFSL